MGKSGLMTRSGLSKQTLRLVLAAILLAAGFLAFLLPLFQITLADRIFLPSGWKLLTTVIKYQEQMISYPPLLSLALAGVLLCFMAAAILAWRHRTRGAALAACAASALSLMAIPGISGLENRFAALGVSQLQIQSTLPFAALAILPFLAAILILWSQGGENLAQAIFFASAAVSVGAVVLIALYMMLSGLPAIISIGPPEFLFGSIWQPTHATAPQFGILPMMLATLAGTAGAIAIGVPLGLFTAIFLAEIAPPRISGLVRPAVELLAGIPSVIFGFFGLQLLVPLVQKVFRLPSGATLFSMILILSVMILPTIVNTAETGLRAVPAMYREASLAIGATRIETIFKVVLPAARSSILSGVILGVGRAIGETMAVIMVAGNVPNLPELFGSVRPMTVGIALEMSYASGMHRQALFAIGLILFLFIMLVNLTFNWVSRKGVQMSGTNE